MVKHRFKPPGAAEQAAAEQALKPGKLQRFGIKSQTGRPTLQIHHIVEQIAGAEDTPLSEISTSPRGGDPLKACGVRRPTLIPLCLDMEEKRH